MPARTGQGRGRPRVLPARPDASEAISALEGTGKSEYQANEIFGGAVRINRYLARAGFGSRRQVEDFITSGRVKVNGKLVTALDTKIEPGDLVTLDGRQVRFTEGHIYAGFNKPAGYAVSARSFPDSPSIYELLPENCQGLKYAGRLDQDSRGLVVLSNDGEFLNQIMHPGRRITKRYIVTLDELPEAEEMSRAFYRGVVDDGEMLRAVRVGILDRTKKTVEVILAEGRKRQIRRMFASLEVKVLDLYRISVGSLSLENHPTEEGAVFSFQPEELFGLKKHDPVLGDFNPWKKED
ncbi:MAG: rRNA pseudouridine synthase [Leptospiraceae bacterium]|nr:rRNA pseudouridine synthase [Leptospiraceae bacterium]